MIVTVDDVKDTLDLKKGDDRIQKIIPLAESHAFEFCNNYFHSGIFIEGYFSFLDQNKISGIFLNSFSKDSLIHILLSNGNNNIYKIIDNKENKLLEVEPNVIETTSYAQIHIMNVPEGFKLAMIDYIGQFLTTAGNGKISESFSGDYSYTINKNALNKSFEGYKRIKYS